MLIEINGSQGEGGAQVLRTALSLAMITGKALRIDSIRGKRKNLGLMRQHLTAVQAVAQICDAEVSGASVGARTLTFCPGKIRVTAESVAETIVNEARPYLGGTTSVGSFLADQLLLPMALAGGGSFTTPHWSAHAATNAAVIQRFLGIEIVAEKIADNLVKVTLGG